MKKSAFLFMALIFVAAGVSAQKAVKSTNEDRTIQSTEQTKTTDQKQTTQPTRSNPADRPATTRPQQQGSDAAEARAKALTERIKLKIKDLTTEQEAAILKVNLAKSREMMAAREANKGDANAFRAQMQEINESRREAYKKILSNYIFCKYV